MAGSSSPQFTSVQQTSTRRVSIQRKIMFTTEIPRCGPQPRYKNQIISVEGWELTDFMECYWNFNFVNFNCCSHTYRNGPRTTIEPSIIVQGDKLINQLLLLEVDNALYLVTATPGPEGEPPEPSSRDGTYIGSRAAAPLIRLHLQSSRHENII
jgi:hypothetical protein